MATVEMSREYPVAREKLWEHLTDPSNWPSYYNNLIDAEVTRFAEPGDSVTMTYRMLGRKTQGAATVLESEPGERMRFRGDMEGLPPIEQEWIYSDTESGTRIDVRLDTVEVDSWMGRTLDRFVLPRQMEKDLGRSLENIEMLVGVDI